VIGFGVWIRKELLEVRRTWRIWVLPGLVLAMAVLSPALARATPALLRSFASDEPGVVLEFPDPVAADALRQWGQSLNQIVLFAVIITSAGLISNELRSGTALLALTKPLSRRAFVLAKSLVQMGLVVVATLVGTVVCGLATWAIFGEVPLGDLVAMTVAWIALAVFVIAVMTAVSTVFGSQAAAAGVGIGVYFLVTILALWRPVREYSAAGLISAVDELATGASPALAVPALSTVVLGAAALALAILRFERMPILGRTGQG
jgi:ABC-2 type transport system permease protein